jgi:hypothetical protein
LRLETKAAFTDRPMGRTLVLPLSCGLLMKARRVPHPRTLGRKQNFGAATLLAQRYTGAVLPNRAVGLSSGLRHAPSDEVQLGRRLADDDLSMAG